MMTMQAPALWAKTMGLSKETIKATFHLKSGFRISKSNQKSKFTMI
jgi:hypothetical protein